jgi:glycosyltransferase involved in cell wall biosynthesis
MPEQTTLVARPSLPGSAALRGPGGRALRVAHLTTVDMSLALLLGTELRAGVEAGMEVFGLSAPGPWVEQVEALGVRHVSLPSLTRSWDVARDLAAARELATALRSLRVDVLHTHNPKTGVLGRILGRACGVPVVVNTCHGLWLRPGDPWQKRAVVLGLEALAAGFSHAELYQNAEDCRTLRRAVPRQRARVVGNGVDLTRFRPDPVARARIRAELRIDDDELLVGGVGRLVAEKGVAEFAAAARCLAGKARFIWVGPADPDKPDALDLGRLDSVQFLGERRDMAEIYAALDVFVLPSYREGFSRSGIEAAACGVAGVFSDIRGCRELGTDGRELLLTPVGDIEALTAAISRLLTDAALRRALGEAARVRANAEFDQRAIAAVSRQTYASVAARRRLGWQGNAPTA